MAAVAPISPWIPEDDLLLKNAVEDGASLEALAKGAVQFSRRFTIRELQDRWHSLLYDPDISDEASAHMVEFELSASNLSSKSNQSGNSKESVVKRKVGSVRRQYYAMRKRVRSDLFNSTVPSFLGEPNVDDCIDNGSGCREHLALDNELPVGSCMLGDRISNHFGLQETDFDILHYAFPQTRGDAAAANVVGGTANAFHTGHLDSLEDSHPNEIVRNDRLHGFPEDISSLSVKESVRNDGSHSLDQNNAHKDIPHILGDNLVDFGNCSGVEETGPSQALRGKNLFKTDDIEAKPLSNFDSIDNNPGNVCSGFGGRQHLSSPVSDGSASLHTMGFSPPLSRIPLWKTIEDISAPAMPINVSLGDKGLAAEETLTLLDDDSNADGKKISSSGYNVVHSEPTSKDRHIGDGLNSSTAISEGDFADLSDSLLNFPNEDELLFMEIDEKDTMDKSCYDHFNSLLLSSPNDVHENDLANISIPKTSLAISGSACPAEFDVIAYPLHSDHGDQLGVCYSEVNVPSSTSVPNPHSPVLHDRVMYCTFNTEDPEIPCNDDIFSPTQVAAPFASSVTDSFFKEASNAASSSANQKDSERGLSLIKKEENSAQSFTASWMVGPDTLPEIGPNHPLIGCGVKSELPDGNCLAVDSRHANDAHGDPSQCRSAHATPNSAMGGALKEEVIKVKLGDTDAPAAVGEHLSLHAEPGSIKMAFPEPVVNPSTSDQEESESDDDVPYFSDIEAMILEMDLGPYDHDSNISREVSRYQYEDTKRSIIRLEQCARLSMQRAIASQGALAILYGRHLKHYIKKAEVILGRATDGVDVDIDLGREGRANKISRRQAIIKMEGDGSFVLKNLGKSSILVNGKEVATGQLLRLSSSSLIEIRGMRFVFEMHHKSVMRYLANITKKSQEKNSNFEWSPEGAP